MLAVQWAQLPMSIYAALFYIVICTTVVTYFLINYGIRHLSPTTVSIYIYNSACGVCYYGFSDWYRYVKLDKYFSWSAGLLWGVSGEY